MARVSGIFAFCSILFLLFASLSLAQSGVTYIYDEANRLVGVIDPSGNAAKYNYDAAGNIISITRYTSAQVSIIEFTPNSGPSGTQVTISGTGFSTTASQNTVKFNGTSAVVQSATANQIVTSVPTGATTGTISVTSPSGSATSSSSFTVSTSSGAPTITSFSPGTAVSGTALTINGSNFQTTLANDRVHINTTNPQLTSATATAISTTVPVATSSGRISVATPYGSAVSTADLFIPPGSYQTTDVTYTGRISLGSTKTVSLNTGNKIGLLLFDATEGQRLFVQFANNTFNPCGNLSISIIDIHNTSLYGPHNCLTYIDTTQLAQTAGTNTILFASSNNATGSIDVTPAAVPPDITGTLAMGAPGTNSTLSVATTANGQNASLTFSGTAGQRVSINATNPVGTTGTQFIVYNPDGSYFWNSAYNVLNPPSGSIFVDTTPLQQTGTYRVSLDPQGIGTGGATVTLYNIAADVTGTLTLGAPGTSSSTSVATSSPGQNASITFSGTAGQRAAINVTNPVGTTGTAITVYNPDGSYFWASSYNTVNPPNGSLFTDAINLTQTGTYKIFLDPQGLGTGGATVTLYSVPQDATGTLTLGIPGTSSSASIATTYLGQNAKLTFSGTSGQRAALYVNNPVGTSSTAITVYNPDGSYFWAGSYNTISPPSGTLYIDAVNLTQTGTYTVFLDPQGQGTGGATVTLYSVPADLTGTLTLGAPGTSSSTSLATTVTGQNASITFSGTTGQRVSFNVTNPAGSIPTAITIYNPDGSYFWASSYNTVTPPNGTLFIDANNLPQTGTYKIFLDPQGMGTGGATVTLYSVLADASGTVNIGGAAVQVTIGSPGQNGALTFSGTSGQTVTVHVTQDTINGVNVILYAPDGSTMTSNYGTSGAWDLNSQTLTQTGTYKIVIDPNGPVTGSLFINVSSP